MQTRSVPPGLGNVSLVLRLQLLVRVLVALRLVLVMIDRLSRCSEHLGETLELALESLISRLRLGQLGSELLQVDFEVPVLFPELVGGLFLLTQSIAQTLDRLLEIIPLLLHVLDVLVPLGKEALEPAHFGQQPAANLEGEFDIVCAMSCILSAP